MGKIFYRLPNATATEELNRSNSFEWLGRLDIPRVRVHIQYSRKLRSSSNMAFTNRKAELLTRSLT